jgi:signal transduction histidine kinase
LLVLTLLGAFTYVVLDSQSQSRREAEKRFGAQAKISAELTAAIFTTSSSSGQAAATKAFGGPTVDAGRLTSLAAQSHWSYALILGRDGKTLAATPGTPRAALSRAAHPPKHVREAFAGRPTISDVFPGPTKEARVIEWALPFETPFGRRVEIEALDARLLFKFLGGYLGGTRSDQSGLSLVLDGEDRLVGSAGAAGKLGERLAEPSLLSALARAGHGTYRDSGTERYVTSAPVRGSTWSVVLSEPTSRLFPALAGSRSWTLFVVLAAFALAGAAGLLFLRRALVSGEEVAVKNRELRDVNASLEQRVEERTAAVQEHARELARSNAELEQFSSVASHDLQEPLRKIRMFGDRLREGLGEGLAGEPASDLGRMQNAAERMQRLINDLLDFSRVTHRGKAFEPVDLAKITREVLADLEARVVESNARVDVGDLPVIDADGTQMRQLIQNLVGNALKFHREGNPPIVRIRSNVISEGVPRFSAEATASDRCVITVEDNGIGFDEKYAERVFTAFERLHNRSSYEGTGIGLSIARKIVWRHGGDITATSSPDHGATFTVTLPVHQNGNAGSDNGTAA